jgi:hypothetical protein
VFSRRGQVWQVPPCRAVCCSRTQHAHGITKVPRQPFAGQRRAAVHKFGQLSVDTEHHEW